MSACGQYMHASCPLACRQCVPPPAVAVPAPAPVPVPGGPCGDSDPVQCPRWKENGDCTSNGAWMSANCALSCGACVATPAAAVPAPAAAAPAAAAPAGPCVDSDPVQCPRWKENGDCTSNSAWMSANCALSCGACQPPAGSPQAVLAAAPAAAAATPAAPAACTDSDAEQCPRWKANGDCASNSEWMSTNCCKSCSATAVAAAPAAAAPAVPCVDSDAAQCPQWKNNGDCTSNSEWMQANCRLSCGVCLPAPTKQAQPCTDSDGSQCPVWASNGDCDKNADWMKANCRRSCKVCQLSAKVVFDGQHPESADWDGHLPGEDSHGCKDNVNMPNVGEPQDNCMHLCALRPTLHTAIISRCLARSLAPVPRRLAFVSLFGGQAFCARMCGLVWSPY